MLRLLCCIVFLMVVPVHSELRPPSIVQNPYPEMYFIPGQTFQIRCRAEGNPQPMYRWTKNGKNFNPSDAGVNQLPSAGTLVFNAPQEKDEGVYQCFASNTFGVSVSITVKLGEAKMDLFPELAPETHEVNQGDSYTLDCIPPLSIPEANVLWATTDEMGRFEVVNLDGRISMDKEYRLRFAHVTKADELEGKQYVCMSSNSFLRVNLLSHIHYMKVQGDDRLRKAELLWSDPQDMMGLQGDSFSIQCIFSGNPTPDILWERANGKPLPSGSKLESFNQVLQIHSLQPEDAGSYTCWGINTDGPTRVQRTFNIRVQSRPYFIDEPKDVETGVGDNVEFNCEAGGDPTPLIKWTINGLALDDPKLQVHKFVQPGPTNLSLSNVSEEDTMVIQCNATNRHGYEFADFYLNVMIPPDFLTPPQPRVILTEGLADLKLTCRATGKPNPIVTWYKDGGQVSGWRFQTLGDGTLHIKRVGLGDAGVYRCTAVNRFGEVSGKSVVSIDQSTVTGDPSGVDDPVGDRDYNNTGINTFMQGYMLVWCYLLGAFANYIYFF